MTKRNTILVSILLILAAILIEILLSDSNVKIDKEIASFFAGLTFGIGLSILISVFIKKEK